MSGRKVVHGDGCACAACLRCDVAADVMRDARSRAGLSTERLGELAGGRSRAVIREMEDRDDRGGRVHADVLLVPELLPHVVRDLAKRAGMIAVELPEVEAGDDCAAAVASIHKETTEAVQAGLRTVATGIRTRAQNAEEQREIREAIEALTRRLHVLERTEREPVVGVRRAGVH